jgi:general stress protein 26
VLKVTAASVAALWLPRTSAAAKIPPSAEEALEKSSLIYVATQRKNGRRSTIRPIWFDYRDGQIFFTTSPSTWKARRIARGSPLYIWVGSEDGPFVVGKAERISDAGTIDRMGQAYAKKYWIAWLGLFKPSAERVAAGKTFAYRVSLAAGDPPPPS